MYNITHNGKKMDGKGWVSDAWDWTKKEASKINDSLKKGKYISKGLDFLGYNNAASIAKNFGYGKMEGKGKLPS